MQLFYDTGRGCATSTVEMFRPDNGGSTYFFVDFDYSPKAMGAYWEIARELNFWREVRAWQNTEYILLTEPQFWVNLNKIKGWDRVNLSVGGEVEISNNFAAKGFKVLPAVGIKWTFK